MTDRLPSQEGGSGVTYCLPEIPDSYCLTQAQLRCMRCDNVFAILIPETAELVMLREADGNTVKWLPTYGVGGYLDLLVKLVAGHQPTTEITMGTVQLFEKRLADVAETTESGRPFHLDHARRVCPSCNSLDIEELSETVLMNPPVDWLKVVCQFTSL